MKVDFVLCWAFVIYALTFLFTSSKALEPVRQRYGALLDRLFPGRDYKMEECRMCMGVWVTLLCFVLGLFGGLVALSDSLLFIAAYGASYFLATQERP